MSTQTLTKGAVQRMLDVGSSTDSAEQPLLQILTVRKIPSQNPQQQDRYRVILSDGDFYVQAMLSSQTTHFVESGALARNCIVSVQSFATNHVSNRRIIIILALDVVAPGTEERIGDPQNIEKANEASNGAAANANEGAQRQVTAKSEPSLAHVGQQPHVAANMAPQRQVPRTTTSVDMSSVPTYPIAGLSPYQNKWTIKARVTNKSEIKHWSNARGEGKLFSCSFLDESGEIRATGFNEQVDKLYNVLKEGHVYYVTKARVNIAKKKFSNLSNEYEITFERDTHVEECVDAPDVPDIKFNFVTLDALEKIPPKETCDVIGVVQHVSDVSEIISKASQKPVTKRELTLVDQSGYSVRLTLWGKTAETYGTPSGQPGCGVDDHPIIAFKSVSVGDFGGRSLSLFSSSTMHVNPDTPEAHGLRGWYDAEGVTTETSAFKTYSMGSMGGAGLSEGYNQRERKTILQAKSEHLGMNEKPDYFNFKGTVIHVKNDNLFYTACPKEGCNKKVTEESGRWRCEKCDTTYEAPQYRYILRANVQDHTGSIWVNGFNDSGEIMIGVPASELAALRDNGDEAGMNSIIDRAVGHVWNFNIRAKQDIYQDVPRERYTITKMSQVDFVKEGLELADAIKKML